MNNGTSIKRVPIKIRKSIQRDFCDCHNIQVLSVDGLPGLVLANENKSELESYLDAVEVTPPVYLRGHGFAFDSGKIEACLSRGLPVGVSTHVGLPDRLVSRIGEIPHCAIHVSINLIGNFLVDLIEDQVSEGFPLREMMHYAKSKKIFLSLDIRYFPHLTHRLDLLEAVDMYKNLVDNVCVYFPDIPDDVFRGQTSAWGNERVERFKSLYAPNVPTRSWQLRPRHRQDTAINLVTYFRTKRLPIEIVDDIVVGNRIKRISSGFSEFPLGMRSSLYRKQEGKFVLTPEYSEEPCKMCGKSLFL